MVTYWLKGKLNERISDDESEIGITITVEPDEMTTAASTGAPALSRSVSMEGALMSMSGGTPPGGRTPDPPGSLRHSPICEEDTGCTDAVTDQNSSPPREMHSSPAAQAHKIPTIKLNGALPAEVSSSSPAKTSSLSLAKLSSSSLAKLNASSPAELSSSSPVELLPTVAVKTNDTHSVEINGLPKTMLTAPKVRNIYPPTKVPSSDSIASHSDTCSAQTCASDCEFDYSYGIEIFV